MNFQSVSEGLTNVVGLTEELESIYIKNLHDTKTSNILVVTSTLYEANKFFNIISKYTDDVYLFPMDEFITSEASISSPELEITRLETLNTIVNKKCKKIIITNLMGLLRYLPQKSKYKENMIRITVDSEVNKEELYRKLCNSGYKTETLVTKTGEISSRGYILDVFPINEENAVRIEFWGDTIESIRYFDINSQLSIKEITEITINPFSEFLTDRYLDDEERKQKYLYKYEKISKITDYLDSPILIYKEYSQIYNSYLNLQEEIHNYNVETEQNEKYMFLLEEFSLKCEIYISSVDSILPNVKINFTHVYDSQDAPNFDDNVKLLNEKIKEYINSNKTVVISLDNESQYNNVIRFLSSKFIKTDINNIRENSLNIIIHPITKGYIFEKYVVLASSNLFKNVFSKNIYKSKFKYGTKISSINSLNIGDYVVHNMHGIGVYQGIVALKKGDIVKDYLQIRYRDDGKLYIPVEKIELISKYSSNDSIQPKLNKLGSSEWQKTKLRVQKKLKDIADEILRVAIIRRTTNGFAFKKDLPEQLVFENEFQYEETEDQLKAVQQIKIEMEKNSPMDMLLCGDVGYGKTEVAFRAMFKAICSNKQVAYLCPTTILSNQQYNSALTRFKNFPVNIALLNRFTSKKEAEKIIRDLKEGKIDILFGTHRILSNDIEFKDIGLLVVDEEQRFGVTHKEKIKKYKANIDVLTLSATPIPRTLQMSMVGLRSLCLIETPPFNRYPVQTYVLEENDYIIKDAIYKELSRGGQVYILCNRIDSFEKRINDLVRLIPDIKVGYAHGRMNKNEIEDIMFKFVNKEFNVLLCTTIIETGIDIPNVNTLIILDADKFGLSQLYQIRGRVGRSNRVAYAYLMYEKKKILSEVATKRLSAIKEFAQLGSGFSIAMRDLSIRGAGSVLGSEQSGFIDTIGIELYLKMLNEEIDKITGKSDYDNNDVEEQVSLNVETHIDDSYVNDDNLKIEIHKIINQIDSLESLNDARRKIEDRFGKISENLEIYMYEELFESMRNKKGIEIVKQTDKYIELSFSKDYSNRIRADELFINAYRISKNFKLSYANGRIVLTLSIINLDKHFIYYITDLLNNL